MTLYSASTIVVVRVAITTEAENAAATADPVAGRGAFEPGTPLRAAGDATNAVVAHWSLWNMLPTEQSVLASTLATTVLKVADRVNRNKDRWVFDATAGQWTPQAVLDVLRMDRLIPAPTGAP